MNAGNVASFACGRAHPQLGERVVCTRARHHAGDHRADHEGSLKVWPDAPASRPVTADEFPEFAAPARASLTVPISDPIPGELDELDETWQETELEAALGPLSWVWWLLTAVLAVALLLSLALVVLAYRAAFGL